MPYKKHKQYRLPGYDYSAMGDYFITICTKNRVHHFGKIVKTYGDAHFELTAIGSIVSECILSIPLTYKEVTLGEWVIMPNHCRLIISLPFKEIKTAPMQSNVQTPISPRKGLAPLTPGSVSSIVNHFKGKVKKWCNANHYTDFQWQARFHDRIIRDSKEYNIISNYIANNISNWSNDENNEKGNNFRNDIRM